MTNFFFADSPYPFDGMFEAEDEAQLRDEWGGLTNDTSEEEPSEPSDEDIALAEELLSRPQEYWDALADAGPPCFCTTDQTCNECLIEVPGEPEVDWDSRLEEYFRQELGDDEYDRVRG